MSLDNVNLAVRIDNLDYTRYVKSLEYQDAAIGGIQYITFTIAQKLPPWVAKMAAVYVYDTRTSECVAAGTLNDSGHHISTTDGDVWQMTAFGPIERLRDKTQPYVMVDNQARDGWIEQNSAYGSSGVSWDAQRPNAGNVTDMGILMEFPNGTTIVAGDARYASYHRMWKAKIYPARIAYQSQGGINSTSLVIRVQWNQNPYPGGMAGQKDIESNDPTSTTLTSYVGYYPNWDPSTNSGYYPSILWTCNSQQTAPSKCWLWLGNWSLRGQMYWSSGTWNSTAAYDTRGTSYTYELVRDVVVRYADSSFDTTNTFSVATSNYAVDMLAYDAGVTAEQILADLMILDPAYRYTTDPPNAYSGNKFRFTWAVWPNKVRYETTLEDGGDFPLSCTEIYDEVKVIYTDKTGEQQVYQGDVNTGTIETNARPMPNGILRTATIDLGNELGSLANAQQAATNFLNDHQNPVNSGTITISRPIRDVLNGGWVQPWEIQAGELIRIRGIDVDSGGDALNASDSDGQSVFRVWTNTYNSDQNTATLELDSWSRTTANAISKVLQQRNRFR